MPLFKFMKEQEAFDAAFREVTRDKAGITERIRRVSRDLGVRCISSGVLLEGLAGGMMYLGTSSDPYFILGGLLPAVGGAPLMAIPGTNKLLNKMTGVNSYDKNEAYRIAISEVSRVYESKQKDPPSREQTETFLKKIFYLPPVGGKITKLHGDSLRLDRMFPSLTSDEQIETMTKLRQNKELDKVYVHQLTVQGRLPDEFKYAALALIINSPYRNDWSKPFFDAHWGKVAPLVHDGGRVDHINPLWRSSGRTDFLQRVVLVHEPELESMEQYATPQLATQFSSEDLANAVLEQEERRRLNLEIDFYQRSAFGLHAKNGTLPNAVPPDVAREGMREWEVFLKTFKDIINSHGASNITKPRWFTRIPRRLPGWGESRHEADYDPIQEALTSLEEIKWNNPSLKSEVKELMVKTTLSIDKAIGK